MFLQIVAIASLKNKSQNVMNEPIKTIGEHKWRKSLILSNKEIIITF